MEPKNTKAIKNILCGKEGVFLQFTDETFDILAWEVVKGIMEAAEVYHDKLMNGSQILN